MAAQPKTPEEEIEQEGLQVTIEEQRRDYDYLVHIYNRMRATESVLLTATFALIVFLFRAPDNNDKTIASRVFFPAEDYGKVIYIMAAAFFAYGAIKLTLNVFGNNPWETAYDVNKPINTSLRNKALHQIKKRYDECHEYNGGCYNKRRKELKFLFFCILFSGTILVVIKSLT